MADNMLGIRPPSVTVAHEEAEERAMTLEHELAECRAYLVEISREMATEASMSGSLVKDSESQTTDTSVDTRPARREMMTQAPVHYTWWRQSPRFLPTVEASHGAWPQKLLAKGLEK